jgi:16S rRNA (adenine1518-N6/adenine1519-N6)-dimethyltransferase
MVLDNSHPKKSLGQHWLKDEAILQAICLSADVEPGDVVLEVGPGLGTLTSELLDLGAQVTALEFDHDLAENLRTEIARFNGNEKVANLTVLEGDVRAFDFSTLPEGYKLVANIPYYLTSYLMRSLCDTENQPSVSAVLMQKEVAERIVAEKGKTSLLSVIMQYSFECELGTIVEKEYFTPPPKVDSRVLIMRRRDAPLFDADRKQLIRLFKAGFSEKRKNLRNALSGGLSVSKEHSEILLDKAGIAFDRRAESLNWDEWQRLYVSFDATIATS